MLVSWKWLQEYLELDMSVSELEERLSMAGLNHEDTSRYDGDVVLNLEVTSNRPDWLGHLGVAREIATLWDKPLRIPDPSPESGGTPVQELTRVEIECPELCPRYTARVIRGVKVGPSPDWLLDRLEAIQVATVNNIVDITNYVLMECGQPLHAFDLNTLQDRRIVVRRAREKEELEAIDHRTYPLDSDMCVIADGKRPVALGGVMGGAATEVDQTTKDVLIEAAEFAPLSIRTTARKLKLHSPSSYRFERGVDSQQVDWASRRCCELILQIAGGELAEGVIDVGQAQATPPPVTLRLPQLERILGIEVPAEEVRRILTALGCREESADATQVVVAAPSWRRDLTREIDLVEEVARVHGYDQIPEDVGVPMVPSHRTDEDRVLWRVRQVMTAAGFDEALTASVVPEAWTRSFSPWTDARPIQSTSPMLKGADRLRVSLTPSLLEARRFNESLSNPDIELFETARVYLPRKKQLPDEQWTLGITSGQDYFEVKGVIEAILDALHIDARLDARPFQPKGDGTPLLEPGHAAELTLGGSTFGYLGVVGTKGGKPFGLRSKTTVAELNLGRLVELAQLVPQHQDLIPYPAISRDMNFVVDESLEWSALAATTREAAGPLLESLEYQETYRDPKTDGEEKKRLLLAISLRSREGTLTGEQADEVVERIVAAVDKQHGGRLLQ